MHTHALSSRSLARLQTPALRSFCACPSTHLMDLHDPETDRGQFWSVFRFAQHRHSQTVPTTLPENRPKNSPGHCQFSVRHSSVGDALTSSAPSSINSQHSTASVRGLPCLPLRPLRTLREVGLVHRVGPLFAEKKFQVPLGALWCLLVPCVGSLTFKFPSRPPSTEPKRTKPAQSAIASATANLSATGPFKPIQKTEPFYCTRCSFWLLDIAQEFSAIRCGPECSRLTPKNLIANFSPDRCSLCQLFRHTTRFSDGGINPEPSKGF